METGRIFLREEKNLFRVAGTLLLPFQAGDTHPRHDFIMSWAGNEGKRDAKRRSRGERGQ